jgi:hypothetical protein
VASVESALRRAVTDLNAVNARWALVGGLAVSSPTVPRFTKDAAIWNCFSGRMTTGRNCEPTDTRFPSPGLSDLI